MNYYTPYLAQYGRGEYSSAGYGDDSGANGSSGSLTNTGTMLVPGLIIGGLIIALSLFILLYKRPRKNKKD